MNTQLDFQNGSLTHYAVLVMLGVVCYAVVYGGRAAQARGPSEARRFERWFGLALIAVWLSVNLRDLSPGRLSWGRSVPLHVCDVVALVSPLVILTHNRTGQAITYFWGLGLTAQTFITPQLTEGPASPIFWHYWLYHYGIIATALYSLMVLKFRPTRRDWRQALLTLTAYMVAALSVDIRLGVNYGFLGKTIAHQPVLITALGPWPDRLPMIVLVAFLITALLQLPWSLARWMERNSVGDQLSPQPVIQLQS